jgi:hypothetical protein
MRWAKSEYVLKGVFLGLLFYVSLLNLSWAATGRVALWLVGGFAVALVAAAFRQIRDLKGGVRHPLGFLVFLILENPGLIYAGVILGLAIGAFTENPLSESGGTELDSKILFYCLIGGAALGYGLSEIREATRGRKRFGIAFALCAAVMAGIYYWLMQVNLLEDDHRRMMFGIHLLLGLPFFYLLVFCGWAEESEVEIAAICATLGLALYLSNAFGKFQVLGLLIPVGLYCIYSLRVLKPLRVFKHTLRAFGHSEMGRLKEALYSFNRALQLNPLNNLARQGLVKLHQGLQVDQLDAETRQLLNPTLCVSEASRMLMGEHPPTPDQIKEASGLLSFVAEEWPQFKPNTEYYLAIADTHAKKFDSAAAHLSQLLDPTHWAIGDTFRTAILYDAWQLALLTHPELKRRVGEVEINLPGRRTEALSAIERQLTATPNEKALLDFRNELFEHLTEEEFLEASKNGPPTEFPYALAEEKGFALLAKADEWRRGAMYLRIAGLGQPQRGPALFAKLAEVAEKHGELTEASGYRRKVREAGQKVGPANLTPDQKTIYFTTVKKLSEEAAAAEDWKEAIKNSLLYAQSENSGKETLRNLAQYYEKDGQAMQALKMTEDALTRGADKDLNERKDRYYYSVTPEELKQKLADVRSYFDVKYCVRKAKELLDSNNPDLEILDWATHLAKLALVAEPKNLHALTAMARCHLRQGERDEGLRLLEDVRENKPSGQEERDIHEWATRQLAALYLDEYNRPDLAVVCLKEFLESEKSGARTVFDLGRAYEAMGDRHKAMIYYQQATTYDNNPIRYDAEESLNRLKSSTDKVG